MPVCRSSSQRISSSLQFPLKCRSRHRSSRKDPYFAQYISSSPKAVLEKVRRFVRLNTDNVGLFLSPRSASDGSTHSLGLRDRSGHSSVRCRIVVRLASRPYFTGEVKGSKNHDASRGNGDISLMCALIARTVKRQDGSRGLAFLNGKSGNPAFNTI